MRLPGWRNGRRAGLKIPWPQGRAGSSPAPGMFSTWSVKRMRPVKPALRDFQLLSYVQLNTLAIA